MRYTSDCCQDGSTPHCNRPGRLSQALRQAGCYKGQSGFLTENEIIQRLSRGELIPAVIDRTSQSHAIVINGCFDNRGRLEVGFKDPAGQDSQQWRAYNRLKHDPLSGERWSDAFEVR